MVDLKVHVAGFIILHVPVLNKVKTCFLGFLQSDLYTWKENLMCVRNPNLGTSNQIDRMYIQSVHNLSIALHYLHTYIHSTVN